MPATLIAWCSECQADQLFDPVPCLDGHGLDCPERYCVECGLAVLVGDVPAMELGYAAVA